MSLSYSPILDSLSLIPGHGYTFGIRSSHLAFVKQPTPSKQQLPRRSAKSPNRKTSFFSFLTIAAQKDHKSLEEKRQLTLGIAPLVAKIPRAKLMTFHPNRSNNKPANTGPNTVAAAMEQLKRAKAWAYAPPGPKIPGFSFSFSSTTTERSAARGETMRMRVQP